VARTWNAAVIGCGSIAQHMHIPGYAGCPGVRLVAACDPEPARRKEVERLCPGLRTYDDYRKLLSAERVDVVSVASPNCFHAEHACAALRAGAHVLLEKPAAVNMKEIDRIRQAVRTSGRKLIVGFSHRFKRGNRKIQRLLKEGVIGEPYMIRVRLSHTGPLPGWAKSDWFYNPRLAGGGAMLDMAIHAIDQALWHLGPVRSVQAAVKTLRKKIRLDDTAVLLLEFARTRALGYVEAGWTSPAGFNGIEIMGDAGCIIEDYAGAGTLTVTTGKVTPDLRVKTRLVTRIVDRNANEGGWSVEIGEVVRAFRRNTDLGCGIEAGGAALAVALAGYESWRTGRRATPAFLK